MESLSDFFAIKSKLRYQITTAWLSLMAGLTKGFTMILKGMDYRQQIDVIIPKLKGIGSGYLQFWIMALEL